MLGCRGMFNAYSLKFYLLAVAFLALIPSSDTRSQPSALLRTAPNDSLSLEQYLDLVLAANPTAISAALEADVAEATVQDAYGAFDPIFEGMVERKTKSGLPTVDFISAGIELPIGSLFGPKFVAKYKRGSGSRVDLTNRTDPGGEAEIGLKLPLLQGIFLDKRRALFEKAALRPDLSRANEMQIKNNLLLTASALYWDWAEAYSQLQVAKQVYDIAVVRANAISERVRRGETAALDSVEALQEVAKRYGDVLKAQRKYESATIKAGVLLWNQDGTPRALTAVPYSLPPAPMLTPAQIEFDRMQALKNRPEFMQIDVEQRSADIDVRFSYECALLTNF
jgi:outer membrane protein TolC